MHLYTGYTYMDVCIYGFIRLSYMIQVVQQCTLKSVEPHLALKA